MGHPGIIFLFFSVSFYFIFLALLPSVEEETRVAGLGADYRKRVLQNQLSRVSGKVNKVFKKFPYVRSLDDKMVFLTAKIGGVELLFIKEVILVGLWFLVAWFFSFYVAFIAAIVGFFIPDFILSRKVAAKKEDILNAFPETVDLLDLCISAGLDFLAAIRWIIEKTYPNAFIAELAILFNEIQVGSDRATALRKMAKKLNIPDVNSFSRTIIQASRMGVSIEEALTNLSEDVRDARYQKGERYAIKSALKLLIPLLFCILPVILIIVAGPILINFIQGDLIPGGGGVAGM